VDRACTCPRRNFVAVEKRELNVHKDHIGMMRGSGGQRPLTVADLDNFIAGMDKKIAKDASIVFLVLDHQNSFGHAFPCCSTLIGTLWKNVYRQRCTTARAAGDGKIDNR